MVQLRKLAKQLLGSLVVGSCRIQLAAKETKMNLSSSFVNMHDPFLRWFMPRYTLVTRCVVLGESLITCVLSIGARSKVIVAIIQAIAVFVVNVLRGSHHDSVHKDQVIPTIRQALHSSCIAGFCFSRRNNKPIPLHEEFIFGCTHSRDLMLRKRNQLVGWIERLNNRRTVDVAFGHGLSLQEIAVFSRIAILA